MALCGSSDIQSLDETARPNLWAFDLIPENEATTRNFCGLKVKQVSLASNLALEHRSTLLYQQDLGELPNVVTLSLRLVSHSSELNSLFVLDLNACLT